MHAAQQFPVHSIIDAPPKPPMPSGKTQQTPRPPIIDPASPQVLAVCS
jgi:hypothetical protein